MSPRLVLIFAAASLLCAPFLRADEATRLVQEELRRRRLFHGDIDGRETPAFLNALRTYQERKGFPATGRIDVDTLHSMGIDGAAIERVALPDVPVLQSDRGTRVTALGLAPREPDRVAGASAPLPGATAPVPTREEMRTFVRNYLRACRSRDMNDELGYYAERVDYFHHGTVDRNYIQNELASYLRLWPARVYSLGDKLTVEQNGDKTVLRCLINFGLENTAQSRRVSGSADTTFTLARRAHGWEIVGQQEERVRRFSSNSRNQSAAKRTSARSALTPLDRTLRKFFGGGQKRRAGKRR